MALTFWYDFSSSYSFLAALRMEDVAHNAGVVVDWQPFLLGLIFRDAGYSGSPNLMFPAKTAYMWRDIARRAAQRGEAFQVPEPFPQKSVAAARAALALKRLERPAFTAALFRQLFQQGRDISDLETIAEAARTCDLDPDSVVAGASDADAKAALFDTNERAKAHGIFGAPTFIASDGELFWGDDRLDDALAWERFGSMPSGG